MGIHSDSIYKDTQREVEAKKVDTEQIVAKDAEGNVFAKLVDTADGGKLELYDETGTLQGEIMIDSNQYIRLRVSQIFMGEQLLINNDIDMRDVNSIESTLSYQFNAQDSAPGAAAGYIVLASPTWDPDGDGNGEIVAYDGSAWQEVVDLPNYT